MVAINIIARDQATKTFDAVAKSAEKASNKISGIQKAGQKASEIGESLSKKVSLPIAGLVAGAVKAADSVGDAMDSISDKTGATGKTLSGLQDVAKNIASKFPASIEDVSAAVATMHQQTGATGGQLQTLTQQVLEASRILGEDGATNVAGFAATMKQANIPVKDGGKLITTLFAAAQKYGVGIGDMTKQLKMFGPQMTAAGLSTKDTIALFGQFNKAGVAAQRIVPTLNPALLKWAKAGKDPQKMLASLSKKIKNATTDQQAMMIASQDFSGPGATAFVNAIRKGGVSLDNLGKSLDTTGTKIPKLGKDMGPLSEQMQTFKNKAQLAFAAIGQKILPMVMSAFQGLMNVISKLTDWWNGLSGSTQKFIGIAAGVIAAIGPVMVIFGKLVGVVSNVIKVAKMFRTAMIAVNAAMAANPIYLIIAAIVALVAIFVVLWNKCAAFRNFWIGLWNKIKAAAAAVVTWFKKTILPKLRPIFDGIHAMVDGVVTVFKGLWQFLSGIFTGNWKKAWNGIKKIFNGVWTYMKGVVKTIFESIKLYITTVLGAIKKVWTTIWNAVKKFAHTVWGGIKKVILTPVRAVRDTIKTVFNAVKSFLSGVWDTIKSFTRAAWDGVKSFIVTPIKGAKTVISTVIGAVKSFLSGAWSAIKSAASSAWSAVKSFILTPIQAAKTAVSTAIGKVKDFLGNTWGTIKSAAQTAWKTIKGYILDPMKAAYKWITGTFGKIGDWFSNLWSGIKSSATDILGGIGDAVSGAFSAITNVIKAPINGVINLVNKAIRGINSISVTLPSWLGGAHIGFNIPQIPTLAQGGMTQRETLARIGDNRSGKEAVLPLDSPRTIKALSEALSKAMGSGRPTGPLIENLNVTEPVDARQVAFEVDRQLAFAGAY